MYYRHTLKNLHSISLLIKVSCLSQTPHSQIHVCEIPNIKALNFKKIYSKINKLITITKFNYYNIKLIF